MVLTNTNTRVKVIYPNLILTSSIGTEAEESDLVPGGCRVGEPPRSRRTASQARREGGAKYWVGWMEYSRRSGGTVDSGG